MFVLISFIFEQSLRRGNIIPEFSGNPSGIVEIVRTHFMQIEIINIGDELLIGQVVNTNASWMGEQLSLNGFSVAQFTIIGDRREVILDALAQAERRAGVVLISGGIGPTKDDITKEALCEYFNTRLVLHPEALKDIETLFPRRGLVVTELNRQQAMLPELCKTIPNAIGTARGMWFEKPGPGGRTTHFISMPGVPFEMKEMMTLHIIPLLKELFKPPAIIHKTVMTQGIGESFLAKIIEEWENSLPPEIRLAYLPQPGIVRLRLTGISDDEQSLRETIMRETGKLEKLIPEYLYGYDEEKLEESVAGLLTVRHKTLATAESCTGGYLAHLLTSVPGASAFFSGSVVAYSNGIKGQLLGVLGTTLARHGAVSSETVSEMAVGVQTLMNADYAIAISGIAGPGGGTEEKPVGTTWIAIATPEEVFARHFQLGEDRGRNIRRASLQGLSMLRKALLNP